jgi:transcriptional regulator with XRE-family HTH domain
MFKFNRINTLLDERKKKEKTLTVQEVSNIVGMSKAMFDKVRYGNSKPTVEVLERIAIYFEKDMNFFFDIPCANVNVQEVIPEFILKRFEELVVENNKLKEKVETLEANKKYRMSSSSSSMVAEPQTKLNK